LVPLIDENRYSQFSSSSLYRFLSIFFIIIGFNKYVIYDFLQRLVSGCVEIQPLNAPVIRVERVDIITGKMNVMLIAGVVKGYHECPFTVRTGKFFVFVLEKKIGDRGKAFRVVKLFRRVLIFRGLDTI